MLKTYSQTHIKTPIIPVNQTFAELQTIGPKLDYKAICTFAALGFFLDDETYYENLKVLKPGNEYTLTNDHFKEKQSWFDWYHDPKYKSFNKWVDEFSDLFEGIIDEQTKNHHVILPLSGGLDSRTQAVAFKRLGKQITTYSYSFKNGHPEARYGDKISKKCGFHFHPLTVQEGYLWSCIDDLAHINHCYTDFTHPRQMAFVDRFPAMGEIFSLGHWGDVLFDNMGLPDNMTLQEQVNLLLKKLIKKSGWELAERLWSYWELEGCFEDYITQRIRDLLKSIDIQNPNARLRAFKSLHWAPRWTSVNLGIYGKALPVSLPYYDDRMCRFICNIPERYLAGRQIQIAYIKKHAPELAKITWQDHRPYNLYSYRKNRIPWNLPYRSWQKAKNTIKNLSGRPTIQRNWELQFLGEENQGQLYAWLMNKSGIKELLPQEIPEEFLWKFQNIDSVKYSHSVGMLLTLSVWNHLYNRNPKKEKNS